MGKLIYSMLTSLDGYANDRAGDFGWATPDEESHRFINDVVDSVGTYLYGRRMYETMVYWETAHTQPGQPAHILDFAKIWQSADKVVYSSTLPEVSSARTRLERAFDADAVRRLKEESARNITINGPTLAAHAVRAGIVDEYWLFTCPVIVGGGNAFFPDDVRVDLDLIDQRRFGNGVVYSRYRAR